MSGRRRPDIVPNVWYPFGYQEHLPVFAGYPVFTSGLSIKVNTCTCIKLVVQKFVHLNTATYLLFEQFAKILGRRKLIILDLNIHQERERAKNRERKSEKEREVKLR